MSDIVERLRRFHDRLNCRVDEISGTRLKTDVERNAEINAATTLCWQASDEITRLRASMAEMKDALAWYGEQARLARLIHSGGDTGRAAIADDGGKRARAALERKP